MDRKLYPHIRKLRHAAPSTILVLDKSDAENASPALIVYNGTEAESAYVTQAIKGLIEASPDIKSSDIFETQPVFFRNGDGLGKDIFITDEAAQASMIRRNKARIYYSLFSISEDQIGNLTDLLKEQCFLSVRKHTKSLDDQRSAIISGYYHFRGEAKPSFNTEYEPEELQSGLLLTSARVNEIKDVLAETFSELVTPKYIQGLELLADRLQPTEETEGGNKKRRPKLTEEEKQAAKLVEHDSPELAQNIRTLCGRIEAQLLIPEANLRRLGEIADLIEFEIPKTIRMRGLARNTLSVVSEEEVQILKEALCDIYNENAGSPVLQGLEAFEQVIADNGMDPDDYDDQALTDLYNALQKLIDDTEDGCFCDKHDHNIPDGQTTEIDDAGATNHEHVQPYAPDPDREISPLSSAFNDVSLRNTASYIQKSLNMQGFGPK